MTLLIARLGVLAGTMLAGAALAVEAVTGAGGSFGTVSSESLAAWKTFRAAQPFQTQVIAVSEKREDHPRTLIISEPPATLPWSRVQPTFEKVAQGCTRQRWPLMSGGEVRDIVCTIKRDPNGELPDILARLQISLFGTSEASAVVQLPATRRSMMAGSLDLRYSATDLHRWLREAGPSWRASPLSESVKLSDLLEGRAKGVFSDASHSMVIWAFDRAGRLDGSEAIFRKFGLQSDLLLGAVASRKMVLVVGRGRVESLSHLPPLRSETMLLLAGTPEQELAQSYERHDLLAGKGGDGFDRAPILLSPQLVDTEFGNLLNVTDQLLKGWSMAGLVRYKDFRYTTPKRYPFGDLPADNVESDRHRLSFLFNWNTDGAAYLETITGLDVMVPLRTGALSVIYGDPADRPRQMEDTAYDYFAESGDVSLARVVQYTLLFQIFRHFDVHAAPPPVSQRHAAFHAQIEKSTRQLLREALNREGAQERDQALRTYWTTVTSRISKAALARVLTTREQFAAKAVANNLQMAAALRSGQESSDGKLSDALADLASSLRLRREQTPAEKAVLSAAVKVIVDSLPEDIAVPLLKSRGATLRKSGILQVAAERTGTWKVLASEDSSPEAWNHTAHVVESQGHDSAAAGIGGHNLDAKIVRFNGDAAQPKGSVSVEQAANGELIVKHNPADSNRLRAVTREVGTRKALSAERIESEVNAKLKTSTAAPPVALKDIRPALAIAAARQSEYRFVGASEYAYRTRPLLAHEQQLMASLKATDEQAIIFEQLHDGSFVMSRTGADEALHVATITAATDALSNGLLRTAGGQAPVTVLVKGVADAKAEALITQIQSNLRRYPKERVQYILNAEPDVALMVERPRMLNAKIAHNGIRVERAEVKIQKVVGGLHDGYTRVEVPLTIQAKTPWRLRLLFFFKDITAGAKERLIEKITAVVATFKGQTSVAEVNAAIRDQLQADFKDLGVDAMLMRVDSSPGNQLHDATVAKRERSLDDAHGG